MKKISIYHFNTNLQGGAAIAAQRLFNSLEMYEDLNTRFYNNDHSGNKGYFHFYDIVYPSFYEQAVNKTFFSGDTKHKILKEFSKYLEGRPGGLEPFDAPFKYKTVIPKPLPDIIHLHWISGFIDYPSFFKSIPSHIPIVWTLHDMNTPSQLFTLAQTAKAIPLMSGGVRLTNFIQGITVNFTRK